MTIYLVIAILLSLFGILSLKYCLRSFDKLELIGLFAFCSGINQQVFYFFSTTFKFVKLVERHLPLSIIRMDYSIISPSLLIWTLYFMFNAKSLWQKVIYALAWSAAVIAMQRYEIFVGLLVDMNWTLYTEVIKRLVIIVLAYSFMIVWHNTLKKDKVIV